MAADGDGAAYKGLKEVVKRGDKGGPKEGAMAE